MESTLSINKKNIRDSKLKKLCKQFDKSKYLFLLFLPGLIYYIVFKYMPMYGLLMAFQKFDFMKGIWGSKWVGFAHFVRFFNDPQAFRIIKNTVLLSVYSLLWGFPIPIILALLLNEISNTTHKRVIQTISYLPHFISEVIIIGILINFLSPSDGIINKMIEMLGGERVFFMKDPGWFRTLYISSGIWKEMGWGAIIYIAALAGINPEIYEAAIVDGASRWKQCIHITLPSLIPTITILLVLNLGKIMDVGFEKVILMQNELIRETSEIIPTYIYRYGIRGIEWSYTTAIGLFNSIIGLILVITANKISKKVNETSLW